MFADIGSSAKAAANSYPRAKSKNQLDQAELAIRGRVRSRRNLSGFGLAGADQLEDSKGESAERQKRNQEKDDFVTAFHNQR